MKPSKEAIKDAESRLNPPFNCSKEDEAVPVLDAAYAVDFGRFRYGCPKP